MRRRKQSQSKGTKTVETLTLDDIYRNAAWVEGHLIWKGYAFNGRNPQMRLDGKPQQLRRVLYELSRELELRPTLRVVTKCEYELCIHPDCLQAQRMGAEQKGRPKTAAMRVKLSAAMRAKSSMTHELAHAIRMSDEPCSEIDARYGLVRGTASRIRRGVSWGAVNGLFTELLAA